MQAPALLAYFATPDGPRPISEIRSGDLVLAYDHRENRWRPQRVEAFHENLYGGPLYTVHTDSGPVRTTIGRPFWVVSGYDLGDRPWPKELSEGEDQGHLLLGRWVNSHDLRCGDVLMGQDGRQRTVLRVEQEFVSAFPVHNLTIEGDHTYAVGNDAVLVHNTGGCNAADKIRVEKQLDKRRIRRERKSRQENGQNLSGEGYRDHASANKGPQGQRPKGPSGKNRERNIGIDEEHSRIAKGTGGGQSGF